jgi:DNA-binding beta-propeller fold protein YncE
VDFEKELTAMMMIPRSVRTLFVSSSHRATSSLRLASLLLVVFGLVFCSVASAQTAHLSGIQITIASGVGHAQGIAIDGSGNLFIADMNNNRVLEMLWNGSSYGAPQVIISGLGGPQGIAVDGSGNLYISDTNNH